MKLTAAEKLTLKTYDTNAKAWAQKHSSPGYWADGMATFKKLLPQGKILEIGAGGGRDARELVRAGYEYIGIDISSRLLIQARKNNPGVNFIHQSVYDLDFPENFFDGFWTSATLLHIPKSRIKIALGKIYAVIKPGGVGFISIKQGRGEKIEADEPQLPGDRRRLFAYYTQDEFKKILQQNGYQILESRIRPMSERTTWIIYFVKVIK